MKSHISLENLISKLLGGFGTAVGGVFLLIAVVIHLLERFSLAELAAIVLAELGAVIIALSLLHIAYERIVREQHKEDILTSLKAVVEDELKEPRNLKVFVESVMDIDRRKEHEAYLGFVKLGMNAAYYLDETDIKTRLAKSDNIKVLKTWFPETEVLEDGLREALENNNASIKLLLSHPKSDILRERSHSAGEERGHGHDKVIRAIQRLHNWISKTGKGKVEIGLYYGWPGCPVIWHGENAIMGFYFWGNSSPHWPWVEVEPDTILDKILNKQFDSLWNDSRTEKLVGVKELGVWLEKNT